MQYSPKLKNAMSEIKDILQKYDIAGLVMLHTEGGLSEFLMRIDPSYSIARVENGDTIRFKANLKNDFNGNKQLLEHKLANTANMLRHFSDVGGNLILGVMQVSDYFEEYVGAEHGDSSIISQKDLDN